MLIRGRFYNDFGRVAQPDFKKACKKIREPGSFNFGKTHLKLIVYTNMKVYTYLAWFSMKTKVSTLVHFIKVSISTVRIVMLKYTHCKF